MFCAPVAADEIVSLVSKFKNKKSPGSDNISPKLLKGAKTHQNVLSYLLQNPVDSDKIWYTLS